MRMCTQCAVLVMVGLFLARAPADDPHDESDEDDVDPARPVVSAEIKRAEFDTLAVSNAISARGLPGDVYRAATVRTGKLVR